MTNRIRQRLITYLGAGFLIMSIALGAAYYFMFAAYHTDVHRSELEDSAAQISQSVAALYPLDGNAAYTTYLQALHDMTMADVWFVDTSGQTLGHTANGNSPRSLPDWADDVIDRALAGHNMASECVGGWRGRSAVVVAQPITLADGQVVGAVVLYDQITTIASTLESLALALGFTLVLGIAAVFLVSGILARRFTTPLSTMKAAALRVRAGDLSATTNVRQDDEIGELAEALDDMTAQLSARSVEAETATRQRGDVVSTISHELRTPVTVLRGSLEALCDGTVTAPAQVDDYHHELLSEAILLERLVNDLLDLTSLQNPDFTMDMADLDFTDVADDALRSVRHTAEVAGISLDYECNLVGPIPFHGDYGRLRQLLVIILDNAIKFSPRGARIHVRLDRSTWSVQDHGSGIDPDHLPHVFERFQRDHSEINKDGTGLGLAIAKNIADRHGV
ncbi:MAG: HAMP domain-containing histidine kinase, partial [Propionibacteriaceae bacterium]|nr:HAMP domain-containing histidine kinase [Propionibacteriaceae bacterium]